MRRSGKTVIGLSLAFSILLMTVSSVVAAATAPDTEMYAQSTSEKVSRYDKIDTSQILGEGGNPPEISGTASSISASKKWYEYLTYSTEPVGTFKLNEKQRIVFYDPFDYSNSLIMIMNEKLSDFSTANEVTVSYTTSNSLSGTVGRTNVTESSIEQAQGVDENYQYSEGTSQSTTKEWSRDWSDSFSSSLNTEVSTGVSIGATIGTTVGTSANATVGAEIGNDVVGKASTSASVGSSLEVQTEISEETNINTSISVGGETGHSDGGSDGGSDGSGSSSDESSGWTKVADRLSRTTGVSTETSSTWSTDDSMEVTRTFNATYFNSDGSPLLWQIVSYTVYMPMYYETQYLVEGEWVTVFSSHCLLATIQGACRRWFENGGTYYEHWGTGERVSHDDFWKSFFTVDQLKKAYQDKLYPDN